MKKTLTVNLGGTVYHIDEDAYVLLDNYLNNLRYYFRREEGAEEIVRDIENRIGELFDEYLRNGQQVITVENVEAVIERMGKPEQLDEETPESESSAGTRREERPRRLFRVSPEHFLIRISYTTFVRMSYLSFQKMSYMISYMTGLKKMHLKM